jgi:hypothetical protein
VLGPGSSAPQGLSSTIVFSGGGNASPLPPALAAARVPSRPPASGYDEERIDIPGTHVPAWIVVVLVVAVIAVLAATAFLLLR